VVQRKVPLAMVEVLGFMPHVLVEGLELTIGTVFEQAIGGAGARGLWSQVEASDQRFSTFDLVCRGECSVEEIFA